MTTADGAVGDHASVGRAVTGWSPGKRFCTRVVSPVPTAAAPETGRRPEPSRPTCPPPYVAPPAGPTGSVSPGAAGRSPTAGADCRAPRPRSRSRRTPPCRSSRPRRCRCAAAARSKIVLVGVVLLVLAVGGGLGDRPAARRRPTTQPPLPMDAAAERRRGDRRPPRSTTRPTRHRSDGGRRPPPRSRRPGRRPATDPPTNQPAFDAGPIALGLPVTPTCPHCDGSFVVVVDVVGQLRAPTVGS